MSIVLWNPVIAILYNMKEDHYHSILYEEWPLPGNSPMMRHKSKMHHTEGHKTLEESIIDIKEHVVPTLLEHDMCKSVALCLDEPIPWDGKGIPAMVTFFEIKDGIAKVVLT